MTLGIEGKSQREKEDGDGSTSSGGVQGRSRVTASGDAGSAANDAWLRTVAVAQWAGQGCFQRGASSVLGARP